MTAALGILQGGKGLPNYPAAPAKLEAMAGLYRGVPETIYHGAPGVSKSDLDLIDTRTPYHYYAQKVARTVDSGDSQAQLLGRAVHTAVLEPDEYGRRFAEGPAELRAKADKERKAELEAEGFTVLRPRDVEYVAAIQESVWAHPAARYLLRGAEAEVSAWWRDSQTGVLCKCRPDILRPDGIIADLKTTRDASPEGFQREAWKFRYHKQAAHYTQGMEVLGQEVPAFVFIAVETEPPYAVAVYAADDDMMRLGADAIDRALLRYHACRTRDSWPAYSDEIQTLGVPPWARKQLEDNDER